MKNYSLPLRVAVLMVLAVGIVSAAGYLTYKSLSQIVSSVHIKAKPDLRQIMIRDIATDLDKAESSVRMYRLTQKKQDIEPYYQILGGIDEKIDSLKSASHKDTTLLSQIDTISSLIEQNILVWNEMIDLYHSDSLDIYVRQLAGKIAVSSLDEKKEKSILKRVFSRKAIKEEAEQAQEQAKQELINDLNRIEKRRIAKDSILLKKEAALAITGNEIRERLYIFIARMENEVVDLIKKNSEEADILADKTYKWLLYFALVASILVISVILTVIRYVRKTQEYQEALERSREETEKLSRAKELFLANMSHEIRTPVNAINGFSEQLLHEPVNEKSRKMIEVIQSTSEHLVQIVNDLLDYSKLENAKIELEKTHFILASVLDEVRFLFHDRAIKNNTSLDYYIESQTPRVLFGDSHRLKQILFNLTSNAIKFTSNGNVDILADAENIQDDSFNLILTVKDTGIGISTEMTSRVFDDFTQAEAGTSRKYGGTGLGLSIVKKLVELHGGKIHLESEVGKGTSVICVIPYMKGIETKAIAREMPLKVPERFKSLKILIVDDEDYNRMLFRTIFNRWDVAFDEAEDGEAALKMIKTDHFDMVFMDARMPGMDGLEASRLIRNSLGIAAHQLPIIGTSATHSAEEMKMYLSAGMNAFLPKPFHEKMLLDVLNSVLENGTSVNISEMSAGTKRLDLTSLYHLANNDPEFIKQLVNSFIETTEKGISTLEEAVNSKDLKTVQEIAHKISSPCKHVGAGNLYSQLKKIEEQSGNPANIGSLIKLSQQSAHEFLEIKKGLQQHLEKI